MVKHIILVIDHNYTSDIAQYTIYHWCTCRVVLVSVWASGYWPWAIGIVALTYLVIHLGRVVGGY